MIIDIALFQKQLLEWYREVKRDLPWRRVNDPYQIWVSEIMLQQTRVETVIPYFERFISRFPTLQALASAREDEVLKVWEGLGYYSRARNLHQGVKEVTERYGGEVPEQKEEILSVSGIGPYTAGAILSIAYDKMEPAVDGNVLRVFSRLFNSFEDIMKGKTRKWVEKEVIQLMPTDAASDFNQAIMELGAMVCIPKSPKCSICPIQDFCEARKEGTQNLLPVKNKKHIVNTVYRMGLIIQQNDRIVLVQRPKEGLLANMWELPSFENFQQLTGKEWKNQLQSNYGIHLQWENRPWMSIQHLFSHLHWSMDIYRVDVNSLPKELPSHWQWIIQNDLVKLPFPKPYKRVIEKLFSTIKATL